VVNIPDICAMDVSTGGGAILDDIGRIFGVPRSG